MALSNLAPSAMVRHNLTWDGQNYEIWSRSIETYLMANDLWDAIELERGRFEDYKTWQKKNAMALCIICTACDEELSNLFLSYKWNAKKIWDHLRAAFEQAPEQAPAPAPAPAQEETSTSSEQPGGPQKDIADLQKAVDTGDWSELQKVLHRNMELLRVGISCGKKTVLHLAVTAGHEEIVKNLLKLKEMTDDVLEAEEVDGYTALALAARGRLPSVAKLLLKKNKNLVHLGTNQGELPVVLASATGHDEMTRYLYKETDRKYFTDMQRYMVIKKRVILVKRNAVALLTNCIAAKIYDVAISLLKLSPSLITALDSHEQTSAHVIDDMTDAFSVEDYLVFWERWIYYRIRVQLPPLPQPAGIVSQPDDIESQTTNESQNVPSDCRNNFSLGKFFMLFSKFGCMKFIIKQKLRHAQALQLIEIICQEITNFEGIPKMLFLAIEKGLTEFVTGVFDHNPDMLWRFDEYGRNPFGFAVLQRQEKIFNHLYEMVAKKNLQVGYKDIFGNNMLHDAAMLAPPLQLRKPLGAALQFQRELHWFQEVKKIVDPKCINDRNIKGETPRDLFTIQHDDLRKEGERWMKDTASSSMTAATLIATMTFTAAFTVPGGNDQNTGFAMFLGDSSPMVTPFMIFVIADTLSLVSSTASVLSFLGVLTTRYAEEDFLESLPRKMIFGLATLFLSMTTMMVAFCATLYIILHKRINWVTYPIAICGGIPVLLFLWFQCRLLSEIIKSTYGHGIFNKKNK